MSVDATTPTLLSEIPARIVEIAEALNGVLGNNLSAYNEYTVTAGATHLQAATVGFEGVGITATGSCTLESICNSEDGSVKILVLDAGSITVTYNASKIVLAGAEDLPLTAGDCLALVNRGGDTLVGSDGTWRELFRILF
jgi:hypothetical protein